MTDEHWCCVKQKRWRERWRTYPRGANYRTWGWKEQKLWCSGKNAGTKLGRRGGEGKVKDRGCWREGELRKSTEAHQEDNGHVSATLTQLAFVICSCKIPRLTFKICICQVMSAVRLFIPTIDKLVQKIEWDWTLYTKEKLVSNSSHKDLLLHYIIVVLKIISLYN